MKNIHPWENNLCTVAGIKNCSKGKFAVWVFNVIETLKLQFSKESLNNRKNLKHFSNLEMASLMSEKSCAIKNVHKSDCAHSGKKGFWS